MEEGDHEEELEDTSLVANTSISTTASTNDAVEEEEEESEVMVRSPSAEEDERLLVEAKLEPQQRVSIYVQVFEEMIQVVLEHESHLFNEDELDMLSRFGEMSCRLRVGLAPKQTG